MAKLNSQTFLTISLIIINLNYLILITADDACPYPCNPPPIAGTTTPTSPTSQTGPYTPPTYPLPPPSDSLPNNLPGTYGGGDGDGDGAITMPPPPDPILPYFPYYYRNGVPRPSDQSSSSTASAAVPRSTFQMFSASAIAVIVIASFYSL